jgi:hypothetical protein
MALQTTTVARQWLSSDHVGIPIDANATMHTTEEGYFLCDPCRDVISRTVAAMSQYKTLAIYFLIYLDPLRLSLH